MADNGQTIATAYVHLVPSAKGIKNSISEALGNEPDKVGKEAGSRIGSMIKKAIVAAGIGSAITSVISGALKAGGALEQSFGGLETLYGDAADAAKEFALQAAQAGIDANTYAEQAVSFGAALKQAFGGDTYAAMEAANTAIMDMADNSAKMGTDIQSIQAAYQGFAKSNYTMLDNLKLGYGGTRTEMERLLKDAEKISGIHYDISNLGDVYEAIHVIQKELGIAGVAADEAKTTLTGSMAAIKAAWQNTLAMMATGGDVKAAFDVLAQSISNFVGNNLVPMIGRVLENLPLLIESFAQIITEGLNNIANNADEAANFATTLIGNIALAIAKAAPSLALAAALAFTNVAHEVMVNLGEILDANTTAAIDAIKQKIIEYGIPEMLTKGIELVKSIGEGIINGVNHALSRVQEVINNIKAKFDAFDWKTIGSTILAKIGTGIEGAFKKVTTQISSLISKIKSAFDIDWGSVGSGIISGIAKGITNGAKSIIDAAKNAAETALNAAKNALGINSPSKVFEKEVGRQISAGIAVGIDKNAYMITDAVESASDLTLGEFRASALGGFGASNGGTFTQNITINSPTELMPSEVARQTRNATQQMALAMSGVY